MSFFGHLIALGIARAAVLDNINDDEQPPIRIGDVPADMASSDRERHQFYAALTTDLWCPCGMHRAQTVGGLCPICQDEQDTT